MADWNSILEAEYDRNKKKYAPKKGWDWTPVGKAKKITPQQDEKSIKRAEQELKDTAKNNLAVYEELKKRYGPPSLYEKSVDTLKNLYSDFTQTPRRVYQRGKELASSIADPKPVGASPDEIIAGQRKIESGERKLPKDIEERSNDLLVRDHARLMKLIGLNKSDDEIRQWLSTVQGSRDRLNKEALGTAMELSSYALVTPGIGKAFQAGGKVAVGKALLTEATGGAIGNAGYTLGNNPDASSAEIFKQAGIGAGFGVGVAGGSAIIGGGFRGARNYIRNRGTPLDELLEQAADKSNYRTKNGIGGSTGGKGERPVVAPIDNQPFVPDKVYNPETYAAFTAKERIRLEKLAKKNELNLVERINNKFFDRNYATRKRVRTTIRSLGGSRAAAQEYLDKLEYATGNVARSSIKADAYMKYHGFYDVVEKIGSKKRLGQFEEYLLAKGREFRRAEAIQKGSKLSREFMSGAAQDKATIGAFEPIYGGYAKELHAYSRKFLREMANPTSDILPIDNKIGIIDPDVAEELIKRNPEYIPLNKVLEEVENTGGFSRSSIGSVSDSGLLKKFKGAAGLEQSPLESIFNLTERSFSKVSQNEVATLIKQLGDLKGNPFGIKILRNADDVRKRTAIRSILKESRPVAKRLAQLRKKYGRELRVLQREIKDLETVGQKKLLSKGDQARNIMIKEANDGARLAGSGSRVAKLPTQEEAAEILSRWVESDESGLKSIVGRLKNKRNRFSALADEMESIRLAANQVATERRNLFYEGLKAGDKTAKGKSTISRLDNGVKEIIEVPDYMEAALKGVNTQQANALIRGMYMIMRFRKLGFTGASPGFAVRNIPRDVKFQATVGRSGLKNLRPDDFLKGYIDTVLDTSVKKEALMNGAFGNLVDTYRPTRTTIREVAAGGTKRGKVAYTITHPKDLFRLVEDAVSITETASRAKAYRTRYRDVLKKTGGDEATARVQATLAARRDSIDFFTMGEYGDIIKAWGLYLNPFIQYTRRLGQAFKEQPIRTSGRMAVAVVAPAIATTYWNMSDPTRREAFESLEKWERDSNHIIVGPNAKFNKDTGKWDGVYKIPKTPGISEIGNAAEELVIKGMKEGVDFGDFVKEIGFGAVDTVVPEESIEGAATPDVIEPAIQQIANKNFFTGKQIVPDDKETREFRESQSSATAQGVSNLLNKAGVKFSPLRIDALIKDFTGSAGQGVQNRAEKTLGVENPGGKSYMDQIKDSFVGAYGKDGYQAIRKEGAYKEIEKMLEGASEETRNRYAARHAVERDKDGNFIQEDTLFYKEENAFELLNSLSSEDKELYMVEKRAAQLISKATGKPIHPVYQVSESKAAAYLLAQAADGGIPGTGSDQEKFLLYEAPWYGEWEQKMDKYYEDKNKWEKKQGYKKEGEFDFAEVKPIQTPNIKAKLDRFNALPQGDGPRGGNKSRRLFLENNPDLVRYFDENRDYRNKQRLRISLRLGVPLKYDRPFGVDEQVGLSGPPDPVSPFGRLNF